jgi:hypothetical protein
MKKSELKQIIKEEVRKVLNEAEVDTIWDIIDNYLNKDYSLDASVNDIMKLDRNFGSGKTKVWNTMEKAKRNRDGLQSVYDDVLGILNIDEKFS